MALGKASRLVLAVFASIALYVIGSIVIIQYFHGMEGGNSMNEWSKSTQRTFLAALWAYPVAAVAVSSLLARRLRAPAVATVAGTASVIGILWLTFWLIAR